MPKILLVEDDNNLREIYEARLQAEGYTIVSARDGEEALVVAKAEKPDLVISDVMMPKISGFEMLDILRNTDGLKDVKVIMLTALGQSDDQKRADKLGADRYLVKSQVTLEDIVKAAQELLGSGAESAEAAAPTGAPESTLPAEKPTAEPAPATPNPSPVPTAQADAVKAAPEEKPTSAEPVATDDAAHDKLMADAVDNLVADTDGAEPEDKPSAEPAAKPGPEQTVPEPKPATTAEDDAPSKHKKVIQPLPSTPEKDINTLLAEEEAKESGAPATPTVDATVVAKTADADASSTAEEEAAVDAKIEDFVAGATTEPSTPEQQAASDTSPSPAKTAPVPPTPATPAPEKKITINDDQKAPTPPAPAATAPEQPADPADPNNIAL